MKFFFLAPILALILVRAPVPAPPAGGVAFSDDFNRGDSDSLGANWTEIEGDMDISGNTLFATTTGYDSATAIYTGSACVTASQYIKLQRIDDAEYYQLILRYTDADSPYYILEWDNNGVWTWGRYDNIADTSFTSIGATVNTSQNAGDSFGVTLTGTGSNTDIRIWRNPTANTPVSATEWDSGDTTPDATWLTTDPGASAVDAGNYVGVTVQQGSAVSNIDNFYGGDIP